MSDTFGELAAGARRSQMLRLAVVGALVLVLQIPIFTIGALVHERQGRRDEAVREVSSKWGGSQEITGPALVVPYTHSWVAIGPGGERSGGSEIRHATFLAESLAIRGRVESRRLRRGIFGVPVYRAQLEITGAFDRPDPRALDIDPASVAWERARLVVGLSEPSGIREQATLAWNGRRIEFLPGAGELGGGTAGIHAAVPGAGPGAGATFSFPLSVNGSRGLYFTPFGKETRVELASDWSSPSFQGNRLPTSRTLSPEGFSAGWSIPFLSRSYPQVWTSANPPTEQVRASRFGVELIEPVDAYRMAGRSVKYAGLFVLLTFAFLWLAEVIGGVRVHPVQFLLLGAALCVFYLLELSLAEHVGFAVAYLLASLGVIGMVACYARIALRSVRGAAAIGGAVAALYAYLFVVLNNEDYALLIGSLGLFATLAVVMFLTRRVNWYAPAAGEVRPSE